MTDHDVLRVYDILKDRYDLILTNTAAIDDGFTIDCPILVGDAHEQRIRLYACEGMFILDIMDDAMTKGMHTHPLDCDAAADDIARFMDGSKDDFDPLLSPFTSV